MSLPKSRAAAGWNTPDWNGWKPKQTIFKDALESKRKIQSYSPPKLKPFPKIPEMHLQKYVYVPGLNLPQAKAAAGWNTPGWNAPGWNNWNSPKPKQTKPPLVVVKKVEPN